MEANKTLQRSSHLQKVLYKKQNNNNVQVYFPSSELQQKFNTIFSQEFITFLSELHTEFDQQIEELYLQRKFNKIKYSNEIIPKFLNTVQRNDKNWKINDLPEKLQCRHVDLGDVSPSNTQHLLKAINSDANGIQIDFDDGHCPTWRNQIIGHFNIYKLIHGLFNNIENICSIPALILRPRAWNMLEHNIMINGKKLPGSLVDFAILMFHNAQILHEKNCGPYFYLSKLEGSSEAKLWNNIFIWAQNKLHIPIGTIKACVLIENILAAYEMDEILYELREHSLGLNCGIWDYSASIINKFGNNPNFVLPDRNKYVNIDKHFIRKYMELVVQTCHTRNAPATGGMAAQLLNNKQSIKQVVDAKTKEMMIGCDGFLIYDEKFIPYIKNMKRNLKKTCIKITEQDLLTMPAGAVTVEGLKHNIQVSVEFIYHWMLGEGHFYLKSCVEDSATAEISRSQIWQWIRHQATLESSGETITKYMIEKYSKQLIQECINKNHKMLEIARQIFIDIVTRAVFVEFLTTYLNDNVLFRRLQHKY